MTTHFQTEALQLKELFKEHTRTISSDPDLTTEAKRRRIEDLRANFAPRLGKLRELHESAQAAEDTRLRRAAFGPASGTSPEAHRAAVSAARLAFTTGGKEALHAAAQDAELGADEVAARAVFAVAEQAGEAELVSAYLNTHPSHRAVYDAAGAAGRPDASIEGLQLSAAFSLDSIHDGTEWA